MISRRSALLIVLCLAVALPASASATRKLSLSGLEVSPPALAPGGSFALGGEVVNRGTRRARARVVATLAGPAAELGRARVRVRPKRSKRFAIAAALPAATGPGSYSVEACTKRHGNRGKLRCKAAPLTVEGPPPPTFTPGARTLNDPLLPQLGNGGYDALAYAIELDYAPGSNEFERATTTLTARATQNLSELSLDFQDLPVDAVLVDGVAAQFSQVEATPPIPGDPSATQPMKLVVAPAAGILAGTQFEVEVSYHGQPQEFVDPDGSSEGWLANPTCPLPTTCSHWVVGEPMGSEAWFPSNNHPSDKATVTTEITVPAGQVGVGVGEQAVGSPSTAGGRTTWTWNENDPTATYLLTASNGTYTVTEDDFAETLSGKTYPVFDAVTASAAPPQSSAIAALSDLNQEMVELLGAHWGPYPLDSYGSVWDNLPSVGYALEVQTKSHFSSLPPGPTPSAGLTSTYLHELAHQWWGNAVTLEHWTDLWFNEGWAVLSEWIYDFEANAGPSPAQQFDAEYAAADPADWSTPPATLGGDPALMFSPSFPTYTRGGMTIEGFREIVGDAAFDDFARNLQTEYAYDNVSTQEFIAEALTASGFTGARRELLDDYFQQWLYGTAKPEITPDDF